ncbi:MAG: polysaccharide deacetylase family protein [Oscillospiraceae bacterium]|nr:polysaccharide deacetylase family protein [Oscillospiraceae bacterium]
MLTLFVCLVAILLIPFGSETLGTTSETVPASASDWGLSFQKEGEAPIANASRDYLGNFNAYYMGDPAEKKLYLTFDAGYENGFTAKILDVLKQHEVPAAFFLVGNYLETQPDLVKRMCEEGHIVGNHTYSHPDMSKISEEAAFREEIERFEQGFRMLTNRELPRFYRPPQGKFSEENLKQAKDLGYQTVFWSLAYVDWYNDNQPKAEDAMKTLTSRIHPGAIVLLHSTSETNAQILDELLCKWKEMGYTFAPLTELTN